ncbi:NAD(P)H-binding protein [Mycolicibacterium mengxianglii]|uniref:NAD(P)H-binding protein n=1 Tax=Mycolicibacterium mengxianglii TaxID=2736649 RepID=UPI0018EEE363|nr:NAD(P)H-binding protein [Mycolicibacterium mengxianglii]
MRYGITGASGQLGREVATLLLEVVDAADVVLTTRNPNALAEFAGRGVDLRAADFEDLPSLTRAFDGIDSLLLISTDRVGDRVAGHLAAIEAAANAGVGHLVYTSVPNPVEDNPALPAPDHLATEKALQERGFAWTSLRNNLYSELQVPSLVHAAASGTLVANSGEGRAAYVTRGDCAAAAVGALTARGERNVAYDISGPQALSAYDLAELAGAHVEVVQVDDAEFVAALTDSGLPEHAANLIASFGVATRQGYLAEVTTAVHDLTGRQPTPLDQLIRSAPQH